MLLAVAGAMSFLAYRTYTWGRRGTRLLARSGLAPVPVTAREFKLAGHRDLFRTAYEVSFVDTSDHVRQWLRAADVPPKPCTQPAIHGLSRGPDYSIKNEDGCVTSIWAGNGTRQRDQRVRVSIDERCDLEHIAEEQRTRGNTGEEIHTRYWGLASRQVLRFIQGAAQPLQLSDDGGAHWRPASWPKGRVTAAAGAGKQWWIAAEDVVYHSRDSGTSFTTLNAQLGELHDSPAVRAAQHRAAVWQLEPTRDGGVLLLTTERILKLSSDDRLSDVWHFAHAEAGLWPLLEMYVHEDESVSVTTGPPATLLVGAAPSGELHEDRLGVAPALLKNAGEYQYAQANDIELLLAPSVDPDPTLAPGNNPRGCSLFWRTRGTDQWTQYAPLSLGDGTWPGALIPFPNDSGRFLIGCGLENMFLGNLDLGFSRLTFPGRPLPMFDPTIVGDEIWFGFWTRDSPHLGVAIQSDGTYRYLD